MPETAIPAQAPEQSAQTQYDVIVVGAGFAGMYALHKLRGMGFKVRVYEAGSGVGGTWYWNRYPGARCDGESMFYSYSFDDALQQEWTWSERYAAQPEILAYANHVADRFDLRRDIAFDTRVKSMTFEEPDRIWRVETDTGERIKARYCIMATGCLSVPNEPSFPGQDTFRGATYHTGRWPHEPVDFTGQRVAVIGTGSSGIQSIPVIARQASRLTVFQRTANYSVPAWNGPLEPDTVRAMKAIYPELRDKQRATLTGNMFESAGPSAMAVSKEERARAFEACWQRGGLGFMAVYGDVQRNDQSNQAAAEFIRGKVRQLVEDPVKAEILAPKGTFGCKRLCVDTDYYATYNRANVDLVDITDTPIDCITPDGVSVGGKVCEVDAIVFATGFDAMTGALLRIDITNATNGASLREIWADGPVTYLGLQVAGLPNLFTITGPGSPSVLTNMIPTIEQHVEWIADCLDDMREKGLDLIAPTQEAQSAWVEHVAETADHTLRGTCNSWYLGANVPGKPRVFMPYIGGMIAYRETCAQVAADGYTGFERT